MHNSIEIICNSLIPCYVPTTKILYYMISIKYVSLGPPNRDISGHQKVKQ